MPQTSQFLFKISLCVLATGLGALVFAAGDPDVQILQADPAGCTWVEAKASVDFGQHDTKHQAMAQAISEARAKAIEGFLGVKVQDRFINFQQESSLKGQVGLTESLLRVTQLGRILKEVVIGGMPAIVRAAAMPRTSAPASCRSRTTATKASKLTCH